MQGLGPEPPNDERNGQDDRRIDYPIPDDGDAASPSAMTTQLIQIVAPIIASPVQMQTQYLPAQRNSRSVDSSQEYSKAPIASSSKSTIDHSDIKVSTVSVTAALRDRRGEADLSSW